jgi:hypothetical protein
MHGYKLVPAGTGFLPLTVYCPNMQPRLSLGLIFVSLIVALIPLSGCTTKKPAIPPETVNRMQTIYQAYNDAADKLGRGPKDLEELKKFLPSGQDLDELLKSPHDGKPYKLVFNVNPRTPPKSMFPPALAYEQEGTACTTSSPRWGSSAATRKTSRNSLLRRQAVDNNQVSRRY